MRYRVIITFLISIHFFSCNNAGKEEKEKSIVIGDSLITIDAKIESTNTSSSKIVKSKLLLSNIFNHLFSDSSKQDTFKLILVGDSVISGQITFSIVAFNGKQIFNQTYPAGDFLGDEADVIPTTKQKEDTIIKRMKDFFEENRFLYPAIEIAEQYDGDNSDKDIWEDIKSDNSSVGFFYSYGYEGTYGIAYSKKKKKVVEYFSSD